MTQITRHEVFEVIPGVEARVVLNMTEDGYDVVFLKQEREKGEGKPGLAYFMPMEELKKLLPPGVPIGTETADASLILFCWERVKEIAALSAFKPRTPGSVVPRIGVYSGEGVVSQV